MSKPRTKVLTIRVTPEAREYFEILKAEGYSVSTLINKALATKVAELKERKEQPNE
jgi:hypothetical protein